MVFSSILPCYCLRSLLEGIFTRFFVLVLHLFAFAYLCEKKRTYVLTQMHLCFSLNALAFGLECTCVLIQTALRFGLNELAF